MCGLAGVFGSHCARDLAEMSGCLRHRGPDGEGAWSEGDIGLAHQRLAVVGLGDVGAQPLVDGTGRFVLSYNGEIYNHLQLRRELDQSARAPSWRGASDTETLAACIAAWGLEKTLARSVGMFALAVWDRGEQTLTLARDRVGEKPLYWAQTGGATLFASQPRSLFKFDGFSPGIDRDALDALLRYGRVPGRRTIHEGVHEVQPGTTVEFRSPRTLPDVRTWWSALEAAEKGVDEPLDLPTEHLLDLLQDVLLEAVRGQAVAEVPVGAFLSGGIDSSLLVALLCSISAVPVKTFTIGFEDQRFDEAPFARNVAEFLGTKHSEERISPKDAIDAIPALPMIYDEPLADISQIPTVLLSRLARGQVTVAIAGDGGDELFGGYPRYLKAARAVARSAGAAPQSLAGLLFGAARGLRRPSGPRGGSVQDWHIVHDFVAVRGLPADLVVGGSERQSRASFAERWLSTESIGSLQSRFMALDLVTYLPDVLLHKVDRAAMAVALETRLPILDHRVVELAWRIPERKKFADSGGKWILRELLARHLPRRLFERPKAGFVIPVDDWLRGPLRPWAEDLLDPALIRSQGLIRPEAVKRLWAAHVAGRQDLGKTLWPMLMFQAWLNARPTWSR